MTLPPVNGNSGRQHPVGGLGRVEDAEPLKDLDRREKVSAEPFLFSVRHPNPSQGEVAFGWFQRGEILVVHGVASVGGG
jgi:hypothetical protein